MHYGELGQDVFVIDTLKNKRCGYFVEFGAMNGRDYSNTYVLEKEFDWTGIVCEPNPRFHDEIAVNRSCIIDNRAVFSTTGTIQEFVCRGHGYSSLVIDGNREGGDLISVVTISLNDLLESHDSPRNIDYISMDTEGSELEILKTFDFQKWHVSIWTIEHNHHAQRRQEILDIMSKNNYVRVQAEKSRYDDWYVKQDLVE